MPAEEPNNKMDELLRAYAKKRREQGEPMTGMHPVTRRLLQEEVKRTFGTAATPAPTRQNWRAWRWPLVGMWGGIVVLVFMFAVVNRQMQSLAPVAATKDEGRRMKDQKAGEMTRNSLPAISAKKLESGPQYTRAPEGNGNAVVSTAPGVIPPAAVAAPPPTTLGSSAPVPAPAASIASIPSTEQPPAPISPGVSLSLPPPNAASDAAPTLVAPQAVGSTAASSAPPAAFAPAASAAPDAADSQFVQVRSQSRKSEGALPPSNLLSNFRMRRSGQNVSVFDADGSVYNGQVLGGAARESFGSASDKTTAQTLRDANEDANWNFSVSGVNNSLQQNINFIGNVVDMPAALASSNSTMQYKNTSQVLQNTRSQGQAASPQNSRIVGKVQVGDGKAFPIEAKPPGP